MGGMIRDRDGRNPGIPTAEPLAAVPRDGRPAGRQRRNDMRRIATILSAVALVLLPAPAVMAAGGGNPPNFNAAIATPTITATILVDTHLTGVTPTAGQATVSLR